MNDHPHIRVVPHNSDHYWQAVNLRHKILREPLGMVFSEEELGAEDQEYHCVYLMDDKVVGSINLRPSKNGVMKMRQVAVHSGFQKRGIGKELVDFTEALAKSRGYTRMECHARKVAVRFYRKLHYDIEGEEFEEITLPHFKMFRNL